MNTPPDDALASKSSVDSPKRMNRFRHWLGRLGTLILWLVLGVLVIWCSAAIWFDGPAARWLAGLLSGVLIGACVVALVGLKPVRRGMIVVLALFLVVLGWWWSIPARNDRDWLPDVAQLPSVTIQGNIATIRNLRNFGYRTETDFDPHWETRSFNLDEIVGLDLFISRWGPTLLAHTIMSWEFANGQHLAVSIETRKEKGESYSAVRGFFRQYELYYVVADERDVIGVRACHRGENVSLYRLQAKPERRRALLLDYFREINRLNTTPCWYNALTQNCTTSIRHHVKNVAPVKSFSWKILANGYLDELLYERGGVDTSFSFKELQRRSDITEKAKAACQDANFSQLIRVGLPK
jgi:hypothetical protein